MARRSIRSSLLALSMSWLLLAASAQAKRTSPPVPPKAAAVAQPPTLAAPLPPRKPAPGQDAIDAHNRGDHETARELLRETVKTRPSSKLWSFLARESDETGAYDEELRAARACLESIAQGDAHGEVIKDRNLIHLSCLFYRAEGLYLVRDLAAASQAANECYDAAKRDAPSLARDRVLADCEKLTRELAPLVRSLNEPKRIPIHRRPGFLAAMGSAAAAVLALGLGLGLRPPADPTDIRTVQFLLHF